MYWTQSCSCWHTPTAGIHEQIWNPGILKSPDFSWGHFHRYIVDSLQQGCVAIVANTCKVCSDTYYFKTELILYRTYFIPKLFYTKLTLHQTFFIPKFLYQTYFIPNVFYTDLIYTEPITYRTYFIPNTLHTKHFKY